MTEYVGISFNAQWPGFASTRLKALAWSIRIKLITSKVKSFKPDFIIVQELGKAEASQLAARLGSNWGYDRFNEPRNSALGINCIFWNEDTFEHVDAQNIDLADHNQFPGRGCIVGTLQDKKTKKKLRIGSSHFSVKTGADARYQAEQAKAIFSRVNDEENDLAIVLGIDTNNRQGATKGTVLGYAKDYGYDVYGSGIDKVFSNFSGVRIIEFKSFDLGRGSDHDGHVFKVVLP